MFPWTRTWTLIAVCVGVGSVRGESPPPRTSDEARKMASRLDEHITTGWTRAKIRAADPADDATFLRRVSLDVSGKIPDVTDVRRFLADRSPEKRAAVLERLLDSPGYVTHFTNVWHDLLMPEANADFQRRYLTLSMDRWLRRHFEENTPYDRMVRELVSLPLENKGGNVIGRLLNNEGPPTPEAFYMLKEGKSENLAAAVSRLFLGVRLECAQCHDHPFGKWKREEFWGQAAFFAGLRSPSNGNVFMALNEVADRRELVIPNTERVAQARFLDGTEPRWKYKTSARTTLAEWMTARDNPYFARAIVNRMWAHFFGIGLVDPVDDMNDAHPPSHPELLDELARDFAAHDFDLKYLIRVLTLSRTYQLSSAVREETDPHRFARMPVRGLTGEQLYHSLQTAMGMREQLDRRQRLFVFGNDSRQDFLEKFVGQERPTDYHTSIPQALTLMNNRMIATATNPDKGQLLGGVVNATFMTSEGKIETLYLAVLSRKPRAEELAEMKAYVEKGGAAGSEKKALADVYWVLLNSTEFLFNH
jgi:hypothetical protein